jgi:hypothetical protein
MRAAIEKAAYLVPVDLRNIVSCYEFEGVVWQSLFGGGNCCNVYTRDEKRS